MEEAVNRTCRETTCSVGAVGVASSDTTLIHILFEIVQLVYELKGEVFRHAPKQCSASSCHYHSLKKKVR